MRPARVRDPEAGFSLLETIVGMMLMSVFGALFTSAMVLMNTSSTKAESLTIVSGQLDQGFEQLDRTVRYAAVITTPGTGTSGDWYVEYQTSYDGTASCTQLRVDIAAQQLQQRQWVPVNGTVTKLSGWTALASGITNGAAPAGSATQPFVLTTDATATHQQLTVNLQSRAGVAGQTTTSGSTVTFTAVNSTATPPAGICTEAGRP